MKVRARHLWRHSIREYLSFARYYFIFRLIILYDIVIYVTCCHAATILKMLLYITAYAIATPRLYIMAVGVIWLFACCLSRINAAALFWLVLLLLKRRRRHTYLCLLLSFTLRVTCALYIIFIYETLYIVYIAGAVVVCHAIIFIAATRCRHFTVCRFASDDIYIHAIYACFVTWYATWRAHEMSLLRHVYHTDIRLIHTPYHTLDILMIHCCDKHLPSYACRHYIYVIIH